MIGLMKRMFVVFMCLVCIVPIGYCEEAMDQDKENVTNNQENSISDDDSNVDSNNTDSEDEEGLNLAEQAKSAIMIEASTGKIIYEKNANESMPMASMTKMMTLLLIMENIESGNLTWDEEITTSEYAASMGGSQIFLQVGEVMTVEDLVKGICIGSGNDVVVTKKQS